MTKDQFDAAYRAFCRRRPFRPFLIEFTSGTQLLIGHPEAVRSEPELYVTRCPDGAYVMFAAESASGLLDTPTTVAEESVYVRWGFFGWALMARLSSRCRSQQHVNLAQQRRRAI